MKNRMRVPTLKMPSGKKPLLAAAAFLIAASSLHAANTYYWDGLSNTTLGASDNTNTAGQTWLSGTGLWDNGTTSAVLSSWTSGDNAVFGGATASGQTVTLGSAITVGNLTFGGGVDGSGTTGTNYTITGSTITFGTSIITTNTDTTIASNLAGNGFTKTGNGTLTLTGTNNTTTQITVSAGTLVGNFYNYQTDRYSNSYGNVSIASGATYIIKDVSTGDSNYALGSSGISGAGNAQILFGTSLSPRSFRLGNLSSFTGTLQLSLTGSGTGGMLASDGYATINTASGKLIIDAGTQFYVGAAATVGGGITLQGTGNKRNDAYADLGAIRLGSNLTSNLTLSGDARVSFENGTLVGNITSGASGKQTLETKGNAATLSGILSDGTGKLALNSNNALTLSGLNSYTGGTTVTSSTLTVAVTTGRIVSAGAGAANGGVTVASGATLVINGKLKLTDATATIANAGTVTLGANSVLDIGSYFNGQANGSTYQLISGAGAKSGTFSSILFDTNAFSAVDYNSSTGQLSFTLAAVPEPATYGLLGAGALAAIAGIRRRRKMAV